MILKSIMWCERSQHVHKKVYNVCFQLYEEQTQAKLIYSGRNQYNGCFLVGRDVQSTGKGQKRTSWDSENVLS